MATMQSPYFLNVLAFGARNEKLRWRLRDSYLDSFGRPEESMSLQSSVSEA